MDNCYFAVRKQPNVNLRENTLAARAEKKRMKAKVTRQQVYFLIALKTKLRDSLGSFLSRVVASIMLPAFYSLMQYLETNTGCFVRYQRFGWRLFAAP
jgi:hypothetical protein